MTLSGTKGRHDIGSQGRTTQIEIHSWEKIDHLPMVGRQMRETKALLEIQSLRTDHTELQRDPTFTWPLLNPLFFRAK